MNTFNSNAFVTLLGALVTALVGWVTVNAMYDLSERGGSPPKKLEAAYYGAVDPLADLTNAESDLSVSVQASGQQIRNLRMIQTTLENTGSSPIMPAEIAEPLALSVDGPWQIINVVNTYDDPSMGVRLRWSRRSPTEFAAAPALLNSGDTVRATVYLTTAGTEENVSAEPTLAWQGRVVNLREISPAPDPLASITRNYWGIAVFLSGWSLWFCLGSFALYLALSAALLDKTGLLGVGTLKYGSLVAAALLNLAAADAGTSFVFGQSLPFMVPKPAYNVPPLLMNSAMLVGLFIYWWKFRRRERASAG